MIALSSLRKWQNQETPVVRLQSLLTTLVIHLFFLDEVPGGLRIHLIELSNNQTRAELSSIDKSLVFWLLFFY